MRILKLTSIACLLLSVTQPLVAAAEASRMALGQAGQLHRVLTGIYGDLFADGEDADAAVPVLAIEIDWPGEQTARLLVPGTEDARTEARPLLFQDSTYDTFVLLWLSRGEEEDTHLRFATFDGSEWSQVYALEQDGLFEKRDGGHIILGRRAQVTRPTLEERIMGLSTLCFLPGRQDLLAGAQLDRELVDDVLRDLVLQREDVVEIAVVTIGP